jgi:hypothetical protein
MDFETFLMVPNRKSFPALVLPFLAGVVVAANWASVQTNPLGRDHHLR